MSITGWLVLIGLVILVVVMNLGLWRALKGGQFFADTTMLYKISRTLRYPWHDEEGQFSELARRVENLKEKPSSSDGKSSLG